MNQKQCKQLVRHFGECCHEYEEMHRYSSLVKCLKCDHMKTKIELHTHGQNRTFDNPDDYFWLIFKMGTMNIGAITTDWLPMDKKIYWRHWEKLSPSKRCQLIYEFLVETGRINYE